ncbi:hypothetical protein DFR28_104287 [Arenicella xantha]|uniref:Periplasmic chaperone for outer membrane proteins Skp n=2 Tax=Arenicella xantha TaxID=644221 RepID=A0A395JHG9_9GAMM|nr:hypothetical protein DFR28_104287 [Arenicella xantha]
MNAIKILLLVLYLLGPVKALAQDIDVIQEIFRYVMQPEGDLTAETHELFWSEIRKIESDYEIEVLKKNLSAKMIGAQEYQKEIWTSVKLSYEQQKIVRSERLPVLESELLSRFKKALAYPKGSDMYIRAIEQRRSQIRSSSVSANKIIELAASRKKNAVINGRPISLDIGTIDSVLDNLSSSFERLENLFDESWTATDTKETE